MPRPILDGWRCLSWNGAFDAGIQSVAGKRLYMQRLVPLKFVQSIDVVCCCVWYKNMTNHDQSFALWNQSSPFSLLAGASLWNVLTRHVGDIHNNGLAVVHATRNWWCFCDHIANISRTITCLVHRIMIEFWSLSINTQVYVFEPSKNKVLCLIHALSSLAERWTSIQPAADSLMLPRRLHLRWQPVFVCETVNLVPLELEARDRHPNTSARHCIQPMLRPIVPYYFGGVVVVSALL